MRTLILAAALLGLSACSSMPDKITSYAALPGPVSGQTYALAPDTPEAYRDSLRQELNRIGMRETASVSEADYLAGLKLDVRPGLQSFHGPMRQPLPPKGDVRYAEERKQQIAHPRIEMPKVETEVPLYRRLVTLSLQHRASGALAWQSQVEHTDPHRNDADYVPQMVASAFSDFPKTTFTPQ